ncbi:MAG: primosomal protein N' (replication factor Y) [Desulforhopalus sp.]|jgi:primosomal protein N' (replication factor Y)
MIHLEVAVAVPIEQTLTYSLPKAVSQAEYSDDDRGRYIGRRALVALGNRMVTGYVINVSAAGVEKTEFTIRPVVRFLDEYSLFHEDFTPFFKWVSDYYQYPIGLVIKAALPGGLAPKSKKVLSFSCDVKQIDSICNGAPPDWFVELSEKGELDFQQIELNFSASDKKLLKRLYEDNLVCEKLVINKDSVKEKKETCYTLLDGEFPVPSEGDALPDAIGSYRLRASNYLGKKLKLSETNALCATFAAIQRGGSGSAALKDIKKIYSGAGKPLENLERHGVFSRENKRVYRSPFGEQLRFYPRPEQLTEEQDQVLSELSPAISSKVFKPFLLHGVTGCGKTEVYLRSAELTLAEGRDVIILVPEIALATQLEAHLLSRFKNLVVLLHSGLSSAEKYDQYFLALSGQAKIVIGARSAIFAPLKDPGLIIVDEEHDTSYKQDDSFRYHGRDLAVLRARHHNSVVILGSATPSITSYENAKAGKYHLLTMKNRVGSSTLPVVRLVDLSKKHTGKKNRSSIIQEHLLTKLEHTLATNKQAVLLLNRRGFSTALLCRDCGNPVQCNHCNVSLTLHKSKNQLICHYCGFSTTAETVCVHCRSTDLAPAGFGTERVEEELKELLPDARVRRIDSDTASDRKKFLEVLGEMHDRTIDILIGTQMIAKGHHFPYVTLVGVVWADGGMSMPDYKAAERTFQLITQVTGRAGRGEFPGEVIIQTLRPEHYAIQYAKHHQYLEFFEHEMSLRKNPAFPPYVRLVLLRVQGKVEKKVQESTMGVARFCRRCVKANDKNIEVLGPAPSPLDKVRDNYRWQILLKGISTSDLHDLCLAVRGVQKELLAAQCALTIDVDPENMM